MARGHGGRSHGHHGHHGHIGHIGHIGGHHTGFHHHHHHGGRGGGISLEGSIDAILNNAFPATLINGVYTFAGSQMSFRAQYSTLPQNMMMQQNSMIQMAMMQQQFPGQNLGQETSQQNSMQNPMQQNMMNMMAPNASAPIQQANITLAGTKTKTGNVCCLVTTFFLGGCLIIPLTFMCCMWWKKIVNPFYELTIEAYRDIGQFIERNPTINNLNLVVVDNAFNAEKARVLYDILSRGQITGFTFVNLALACNGQFNEADTFLTNVAPIKSLNIGTSITWGDMIA